MKKNLLAVDARLVPDSPRYADWCDIMDGDTVPLASDVKAFAEGVDTYAIDIERLRPVQFNRLVDAIEKKMGLKRSDAYRLARKGFRIRAEDVRIYKTQRNFL